MVRLFYALNVPEVPIHVPLVPNVPHVPLVPTY